MDGEIPLVARDESGRIVREFLALHGPPAYIRRARQVQEAFDQLLARCQARREEWLDPVRRRLGTLLALAGDPAVLAPYLGGEIAVLTQLQALLAPSCPSWIDRTASPRKLRQALAELQASVARFNQRWLAFVREVDLGPVNALREGYNRYYVLEKECAVRSPRVARLGFRPLEPLRHEELLERLPPLPAIDLAD